MVKKSGILNKLVGKFRSGSAVRVETDRSATRGQSSRKVTGAEARGAGPSKAASSSKNGNATRGSASAKPGPQASAPKAAPKAKPQPVQSKPKANPVEPVSRPQQMPVQHVPEEIIPTSKRKLSAQESAQITMDKSFQELSSLLRGVSHRMEGNGDKLDVMGAHLAQLPVAAQQQVALLQSLVTQLENQNSANGKMFETFAELPKVMKGVQESLERSAARDERTSKTLDDFKGTMDRIQGSIGDMVTTAEKQAKTTSEVASDNREAARSLKSTTNESLEALRMAQEDQANRMSKIIQENGRSNRIVLVAVVLGFAAMVAVLFGLFSK